MTVRHTGNVQPAIDLEEHDGLASSKRSIIVGTDGLNYYTAKVNSSGQLSVTAVGGGSTQQYTDGDAIDTTSLAVLLMGTDAIPGTGYALRCTTAGHLLQVITDGTRTATVRDTGASDSLNVAIVDAAGNQITTFGGGTQYTEGDTDATITGTALMWEDAADTLVVASAAKPLPVSDAGGSLTVDGTVAVSSVSGTVTVGDGGGSLTVDGTVAVSSVAGSVTVIDGGGSLTVDGTVSVTEPVSIDDNGGSLTVDGTVAVSSVGGSVTVVDGGGSLTVDGTVSVTEPVSIDDNGGSITVDGTVIANAAGAATATLTNVAASASSVTLLASNANRLHATIMNDSTATLYVKFGATASTSSFTVKMVGGAYFEIPGPRIYTGIIDGIWDSATGAARVTEITA